MDRKKFLVSGVSILGLAAVAPAMIAGKKEDEILAKSTCTVSPTETEGPFPTQNASTLEQVNIVGDRTGVDLEININVQNSDNNCSVVEGLIVDIWHCDKDGYYSQYGGTSMQTVDYTSENFLRGRQVTDSSGNVSFVSIFPGWYQSRATHIHVHIYDASGSSLLVTQISFPEGTGSAVETVNAATSYGYTKGMTGYTYNSSDNVFSDDTTDAEMCSVTGSVANGYVLNHEIRVSAGETAAIEEQNVMPSEITEVYPNPIESIGNIDITLKEAANVQLKIYDLKGVLVATPYNDYLSGGLQKISFHKGTLRTGIYVYTLTVISSSGTYEKQSKLIVA